MVYQFLRLVTSFGIKFFYRRIYIKGIEDIPMDKPLFIACNHPAGFIEPVITACIFPRPLYFLTRGDLFKNKVLAPLLRATNQIPIFRSKDGFRNLRHNKESIKRVVEVLKAHNAIMIFIEGGTENVWHLRPLKKGMGNMILETLHQAPSLDLHILPMGITLTKSAMVGAEVFINFGKAIPVGNLSDPKEANFIQEYNKKLYPLIRENLIHLNTKRQEWYVKRWIELKNFVSTYRFYPRFSYNDMKYNEISRFSEFINNKNSAELKAIRAKLLELRSHITSEKIGFPSNGYLPNLSIQKYIFLILGVPGLLFYLLPIGLAGQITARFVGTIEFFGAVLASTILGFTLIWNILMFVILGIYWSWLNAFFLLILLALSGILYLAYQEVKDCHNNKTLKIKIENSLQNLDSICTAT